MRRKKKDLDVRGKKGKKKREERIHAAANAESQRRRERKRGRRGRTGSCWARAASDLLRRDHRTPGVATALPASRPVPSSP